MMQETMKMTLIFFPRQTNIEHMKYEHMKPQRKQFVHNESIRSANYSFSSTLSCNTFTFYFSCSRILCSRKLLGTVTTFSKNKKKISLVFQFEKNMLKYGLPTFKFLNSLKARLCVLFCKQVTLF